MNRDLADLLVFVLGFLVLGLAAHRFGADSGWDEGDRTDRW